MVQNFSISLFINVSPEAGQVLAVDRLLRECKMEGEGLPCGAVVRTVHFQCRGHRFDPWLGD